VSEKPVALSEIFRFLIKPVEDRVMNPDCSEIFPQEFLHPCTH